MKKRTTVVVLAEVGSGPDFCEETKMTTLKEVEIVVPFMKNPEEINLGIKLNVLRLLKLKIAPEDL